MAMNDTKETLIRLSDSHLTLRDDAEDIRGLKVVDLAGEELGKIDDLFIDQREQKVRFLELSSGGFLGLGATKFLLPVDAITRITSDVVYANQSRERVAGAPQYDPTLVEERYLSDVYSHYGYPPYWGTDYHYPAYPYYMAESHPADETEIDKPYPRYMGESRPADKPKVDAQRDRRVAGVDTRLGSASSRKAMQVKEIMSRQVEVVHPEATLWEAAQKMAALDVGPLPVTVGNELVGMLTDRDITVRATAHGRDPKTTRVHEIMTPEVIYAYEDEDVSEAARIMGQEQIRRLVVLNQSKQLVGIVSLGDLAVHSGDVVQAGETLEDVSEPSEPQR